MDKLLTKNMLDIELDLKMSGEISYTPRDILRHQYKIDYDIILTNGIPLQRQFVWTLEQKRELIISILKGIKLPRFAVLLFDHENKERTKELRIVDGKQRLSTILGFMNNEFSITIGTQEYFYKDFDAWLQGRLWNLDLRFDIVYEYPDAKISDEKLVKWFELVNWAGTPQDKQHFEQLKNSLK